MALTKTENFLLGAGLVGRFNLGHIKFEVEISMRNWSCRGGKIIPGKLQEYDKISKSGNIATVETQVHGKKTKCNTEMQASRIGKESGEEDDVSQKRKVNAVVWWVSAGLGMKLFLLAIVRSLFPRRDQLQCRWNLVGSESKVEQRERGWSSDSRLLFDFSQGSW